MVSSEEESRHRGRGLGCWGRDPTGSYVLGAWPREVTLWGRGFGGSYVIGDVA